MLLIFSPAYLYSYLWSDDFPVFVDPESMLNHATRDLRPVYGLLIYGGFSSIDNVDQVALLRLISAIGVIFLIVLIHTELRAFFNKNTLLPCLIFAFCTHPWLNVVYWATTYVFSWSVGIALLGLRLTKHHIKERRIVGIFLIAISSLIYPVSTLFPIAITYIRGLLEKKNPLEILFNCIHTFLLLLSVIIASLISSRFFIDKVLGLQPNPRVQLVNFQEIPEKLLFFSTRLIGQSIRFFSISSPSILEFLFGFGIIFILINIFFRICYAEVNYSPLQHTITLFTIFLMLLSPFAIVADNQIDIRYFIGTNWLSAMMISLLFVKLIGESRWNYRLRITFFSSILIGLAATNSIQFFQNVVRPITTNTQRFIQSQFSDIKIMDCENRIQIVPRTGVWPTKNMIGMASQVTDLASSWVPVPAVKLYVEKNYSQLIAVDFTNNKLESESNCLVDLNLFR